MVPKEILRASRVQRIKWILQAERRSWRGYTSYNIHGRAFCIINKHSYWSIEFYHPDAAHVSHPSFTDRIQTFSLKLTLYAFPSPDRHRLLPACLPFTTRPRSSILTDAIMLHSEGNRNAAKPILLSLLLSSSPSFIVLGKPKAG